MIRFCKEAADEIDEAIDWYLSKSTDAAERFSRAISNVLVEIEADPNKAASTQSATTHATDSEPSCQNGSFLVAIDSHGKTVEGTEMASLPDLSMQNSRRATHHPLSKFVT